MKYQATATGLVVCAFAIGGIAVAPAAALDCSQKGFQSRPIDLGVSGGNIHSFQTIGGKRFCFDGTLGSMVQSAGKQFILSNNHVLADTNKAKPGQQIVQPGVADTSPVCQKISADALATFTRTVKVKFGGPANTIDAAIAEITPGDVNPEILNIGPIASTTVAPSPGLAVQKMGRTTCLTLGNISAVGAKIRVSYGGGKIAKFLNQIVISSPGPPNNFGGPGDSGSLLITQDPCPQAVGLVFADSADETQIFANPISDVLSGLNVTMVGGCTPAETVEPQANDVAGNIGMSKDVVDSAMAVRDRHEDQLMSIPGAVGTGIGLSDKPGQPAIEVYIKKMTPEAQAAAPKEVEGLPVKLIENGGIVAY